MVILERMSFSDNSAIIILFQLTVAMINSDIKRFVKYKWIRHASYFNSFYSPHHLLQFVSYMSFNSVNKAVKNNKNKIFYYLTDCVTINERTERK